MGTVDDDTAALYDAAMTLSRTAFAGRHYAVAYHSLAAALHAAYDLGDDERLAAVGEVCQEQQMWLDDREPQHELSSQSAIRRGTHSLWATLRQDVQRRRQMLEHHRRMQQMRPHARA